MTPDRALKAAIMDEAEGSSGRTRPARKRRDRKPVARGAFARRFALRLILLAISIGATRMLLYTDEGRAAFEGFQTALLEVVQTEMAARASAPDANAQAAETQTAEAAPAPHFVSAPQSPEPAQAPAQANIRPKVSQLPESRVAVRRLWEDG